MAEEWKDIEGYEGIYQISNLGKIKKLNFGKNKIIKLMKPYKDKQGYLNVVLNKDGKLKKAQIHRLVAIAFIPNPLGLPQVNHKKEFEKDNNKVDNLEWCTAKYNANYGTHNERISKSKSKKVYQYSKEGELIQKWNSTIEAERSGKGFDNAHISACCRNERRTHKGYIWSYSKLNERACFQ